MGDIKLIYAGENGRIIGSILAGPCENGCVRMLCAPDVIRLCSTREVPRVETAACRANGFPPRLSILALLIQLKSPPRMFGCVWKK